LPRPARRDYPARITPDCVDDSNLDTIENAQSHVAFFITAIGSNSEGGSFENSGCVLKIYVVLTKVSPPFSFIPFEFRSLKFDNVCTGTFVFCHVRRSKVDDYESS
jgi:hypothetical protein